MTRPPDRPASEDRPPPSESASPPEDVRPAPETGDGTRAPLRSVTAPAPEDVVAAVERAVALPALDVIIDTAEWLVSTGYPYDWSTSARIPPPAMREAIARAWWNQDRLNAIGDVADLDAFRYSCADAGGWPWPPTSSP